MPLPYDAESPYYVRHPFAEFKLMPIRMSLIMDQHRIPKLLVECANSNMPIEVRRVRIAVGADYRQRWRHGRRPGRGRRSAGHPRRNPSLDLHLQSARRREPGNGGRIAAGQPRHSGGPPTPPTSPQELKP